MISQFRDKPLSAAVGVLLIPIVCLLGAESHGSDGNVFFLGNSLTNDILPRNFGNHLARSGINTSVGFHIRSASTLSEIAADPLPSTVNLATQEFGPYGDALPNHDWDFVSLQPFPVSRNTRLRDIAAARQFIELARSQGRNSNTRFVLYAPWPRSNLWQAWNDPAPPEDEPSIPSLDHHLTLQRELASQTDAPISLVPIGEAWNNIRNDILAGVAPRGLDRASQLYRDPVHASGLGRYINILAFSSVVYGIDVRELPTFNDGSGAFFPTGFDAEVIDYVQDSVWRTLDGFANARGDLDRNGAVELADLRLWSTSFGPQPSLVGDLSGDDRVDGSDLALWDTLTFPVLDPAPADYNNNGRNDPDDLRAWAATFGQNGGVGADGNGDSTVNAADYTLSRDFQITDEQRAINSQLADLNNDGFADGFDRLIIEQELGNQLRTFGDINRDREIDAAEYSILRDSIQQSAAPAAVAAASISVPEPTASVLATTAAATLLRRRRSGRLAARAPASGAR